MPNELAIRNPNDPAPKEETLEQILEAAVERGKKKLENWGKDRVRGFFKRIGLRD